MNGNNNNPTTAQDMKAIRRMNRLSKEIKWFKEQPLAGITCKPLVDDVYDHLVASMKGPDGSPYERGTFTLDITIPENYPMDPPQVKFSTPVYHPNIDRDGRICMDLLKREGGSWLGTISLQMLLLAIQSLLLNPNPDDPLERDVAHEYRYDHDNFVRQAQEHTAKHAVNIKL